RRPCPIDKQDVPPNVIKMQVRIEDVIDSIRLHVGGMQPVEKIRVQVVPTWDRGTSLSIADTRINDDRLAINHDQERLHHPPQTTRLVNKIGCQPGRSGDSRQIELGNQPLKRRRGVHISYAYDGAITP